jgi:hypothetical protein
MTRDEFNKKYSERSYSDTSDVLMRIASNLSELQHDTDNLSDKLNLLKEYIFDYKTVIRNEKLDI